MKNNVKEIERKIKAQELMEAKLSNKMKSMSSSQLILQDNLNNLKETQVKEFQIVKQQMSNQNESISKIEELNFLTRNLSRDVKNTKIALFISISIICVLVILIISGVL